MGETVNELLHTHCNLWRPSTRTYFSNIPMAVAASHLDLAALSVNSPPVLGTLQPRRARSKREHLPHTCSYADSLPSCSPSAAAPAGTTQIHG